MAVILATPPLCRQPWRPDDRQVATALRAPEHGRRWAAAAVGVAAVQLLRSKAANGCFSGGHGSAMRRDKVSLMAQPEGNSEDEEARKLWQEAYAIEVERAERLQISSEKMAVALPAPQPTAPAAEWQAAYEALKAQTTTIIHYHVNILEM